VSRAGGTAKVLSVGDRVLDGDYRVHSRFKHVVNLRDGRKLVSLVARPVGAGPINLVLSRFDPGAVRSLSVGQSSVRLNAAPLAPGSDGIHGSSVRLNAAPLAPGSDGIRGSSIRLNSELLDLSSAAVYRSSIDVRFCERRTLERNTILAAAVLKRWAVPESLAFLIGAGGPELRESGFAGTLRRHLTACARDIFCGDMLRGARRMSGCGPGLTPSGDDFLVGLMLALHVVEQVVGRSLEPERHALRRAAGPSGLLAEAFLDLAFEGRAFEKMRKLVVSLAAAGPGDLADAVDGVLTVGATSGADAAVGLCLGIDRGLRGWPRSRPAGARREALDRFLADGQCGSEGAKEALWS